MPIWFVREHGDKIKETVNLFSRATGRTWSVNVVIYHPERQPQVMFCQGWCAFASFNCLVEGDHVTFTLTAMSEFEVFISRNAFPRFKEVSETQSASPKRKVQHVPAEKKKSKLHLVRCTEPTAIQSASRDGESSFSKSHTLAPVKFTNADLDIKISSERRRALHLFWSVDRFHYEQIAIDKGLSAMQSMWI